MWKTITIISDMIERCGLYTHRVVISIYSTRSKKNATLSNWLIKNKKNIETRSFVFIEKITVFAFVYTLTL